MAQPYIFLCKENMLIPQSLEEPDAGEIIRSLLLQHFTLSSLRLQATDSRDALAQYGQLKNSQKQTVPPGI